MWLDVFIFLVIGINTVLGIGIFFRNRSLLTNRLFSAFVVFLNLWIISNFLENEPRLVGIQNVKLFLRLDFALGAVFIFFWFQFCWATVAQYTKHHIPRWMHIISIALLSALIIICLFTDLLVTNISFANGVIQFTGGQTWILYGITILSWAVGGLIVLIVGRRWARKTGNHNEGRQIRLIFYGFTMALGNAIIINFIQAFYPISLELSRFGLYGLTILVVCTAYAIVRLRLFELRILIVRTMVFLGLSVLAAFGYAVLIIIIIGAISDIQLPLRWLITAASVSTLVTLTFNEIHGFLEQVTDRFFFKGRYNAEKLLSQLTHIMAENIDLDRMSQQLLTLLITELRVTNASLIIAENQAVIDIQAIKVNKTQLIKHFKQLTEYASERRVIIFDELNDETEKEVFRKLDIAFITFLETKDKQQVALVLGPKANGEPYYEYDVNFLEIFSSEAGIAVENAHAVKQIVQLDEAKSEFISVISHQLRTPVSIARWNMELVLEGNLGRITAKIKEALETGYQGIISLNTGLNDLILALEILERKIFLHAQKLNVATDLIEPLRTELDPLFKQKQTTFINTSREQTQLIMADKDKLLYALRAMIINAVLYSPPKSNVTLTSSIQDDTITIAVIDAGIGIETKYRESVFKRFFRGEEARRMSPNGIGLGLFIARSYIELHGGKLWFKSVPAPGHGTEFYFAIPRSTASSK